MDATPDSHAATDDTQRLEERRRLIDAWRRFESNGKPGPLLETARPVIARRCTAIASDRGLDRDEVYNETLVRLREKKLHKKPTSPCVNDDHCVGKFGLMLRRALLDATSTLADLVATEAQVTKWTIAMDPAPPCHVEDYTTLDYSRYAAARLRQCLVDALTVVERQAVEWVHLAEERITRREIATRLNLTERGLYDRVQRAFDKLRRCLKRHGVEP